MFIRAWRSSTVPGQFVGAHPVDFLGREERRGLQALALQRAERFEHPLARNVLVGVGPVHGVFQVVARRCGAQHHVGHIFLFFGLQRLHHLGRAADADQQNTRSQRVEGPGVAHLDALVTSLLQGELDFADHVGRGPFQRLVQHGDVALLEVEAPEVELSLGHMQ